MLSARLFHAILDEKNDLLVIAVRGCVDKNDERLVKIKEYL